MKRVKENKACPFCEEIYEHHNVESWSSNAPDSFKELHRSGACRRADPNDVEEEKLPVIDPHKWPDGLR